MEEHKVVIPNGAQASPHAVEAKWWVLLAIGVGTFMSAALLAAVGVAALGVLVSAVRGRSEHATAAH